ncbi:MAG TPA: SRPBCC domain-containing protein, partial [Candidatus Limnocylindria bacterium]|nr:SRPBCC domain-containing protein [Candidatus Limnocylindria bacterium]
MTTTNDVAADFLGREFTITREFAAPRELVFRTWTEAKHVAQWWSPKGFTNPVCEWDARPGGKVYVVMQAPNGTRYPMGGEFREVVAPERLVLTTGALDEQGNLMFELLHTVTFAEENGQTALTIQSEVIKTSPGAGKYIGGYEAGMSQSLERLADRIENLPLVVERTFDAPIA